MTRVKLADVLKFKNESFKLLRISKLAILMLSQSTSKSQYFLSSNCSRTGVRRKTCGAVGCLTWLHHAPPIRAWTEKMMRHATTEETLEISLELMTSPKLCQFTASLLTLLTLLLLLCFLVFSCVLHRSAEILSIRIKNHQVRKPLLIWPVYSNPVVSRAQWNPL